MPTEAQLVDALSKADAAGDTASAQQFASMIKAQRASGGNAALPAAPQQDNPAARAFAAGQQQGAQTSPLMAGVDQAANSVLFGQGDRVMGALRYVGQRIAGVPNPDSYDTDRAYMGGQFSGSQGAHPVAGTVGGVTGSFLGGAGVAKTLDAARELPVVGKTVGAISDALTPVTRDAAGTPLRTGSAVGNVLKSGAANGVLGFGIAKADGQDTPSALQTAGISALAGPTVGKMAEFGLSKLLPASQRAFTTLAQAVRETPAVLEKAYDTFVKTTGAEPTMAQLADLKSRGAIKSLAKANATVGQAANVAANAGSAPLHEQLQTFATRPQTEAALNDFRDTQMDQAMSTPHPQTGVALRDTPVNDPAGILTDPHIEYALRPNTAINQRLNQASPLVDDRIPNNTATIGDIETIRKALRDQQNSLMRPAPGSNSSRDPILAKEFGDMAAKVESLGSQADPDYARVLGNYRHLSRYGQGLAHGATGRGVGDIDTGDSQLGAALKTPMGLAGYEHGNALYNGRQALNSIAPSSIAPEQQFGAHHATQAAMAASSGGVGAIYHAMRAIPGLHLPDSAQQIVARQLFDPSMSKQAVANLRRGRVTDQQIRQLGTMIGGAAGANISSYLSQGQGQ